MPFTFPDPNRLDKLFFSLLVIVTACAGDRTLITSNELGVFHPKINRTNSVFVYRRTLIYNLEH